MRTPNEVIEVIEDLQRWRDVRSRLTERNLQRKQTGKRTVLQNDSLTIAIALLLEYRQLLERQPATGSWVIYWYNPLERTHDHECFDSREAADTALAEFAKEYPWNHYTLSQDIQEVKPTEKWPGPYGKGGGPVVAVEPTTGVTLWAEANPFEMKNPVVTFAPEPQRSNYTVVAKGHHHVFSDEAHAFRTYLEWAKLPKVDDAVADLMAELHARFAERAADDARKFRLPDCLRVWDSEAEAHAEYQREGTRWNMMLAGRGVFTSEETQTYNALRTYFTHKSEQ